LEKSYSEDVLSRALGMETVPDTVMALYEKVKLAKDRLGAGGPLSGETMAIIAILATGGIPKTEPTGEVDDDTPDIPEDQRPFYKVRKNTPVIAYVNGAAVTGKYLGTGNEPGTIRIKVDGSEENFVELNEKDVKVKPKEQ
jgi:hypothetical protein